MVRHLRPRASPRGVRDAQGARKGDRAVVAVGAVRPVRRADSAALVRSPSPALRAQAGQSRGGGTGGDAQALRGAAHEAGIQSKNEDARNDDVDDQTRDDTEGCTVRGIPGLRCATPRGVAQRSPGISSSARIYAAIVRCCCVNNTGSADLLFVITTVSHRSMLSSL